MSSGLEAARNYHRWNFAWIEPHVRGRILDVGGGTGNHLAFLRDAEIVSIDLSREAVEELRAKHSDLPNWSFEVGDITDAALIDRLGPASFDTVLSCNVFEHIPDDALAFEHAARLLKPGGRLVLLLPAHQRLYGSMDQLAGHFRRYSRSRPAADRTEVRQRRGSSRLVCEQPARCPQGFVRASDQPPDPDVRSHADSRPDAPRGSPGHAVRPVPGVRRKQTLICLPSMAALPPEP
jgi:SAM-dependent methyltransferase